MENTAIFVVSHGKFSKCLVESAEFIVGETNDIYSFCLEKEMSLEDLIDIMEKEIKRLNKPVIILTDLFGGTPNNAAMYLKHIYNVNVIAGVNLQMLLELILSKDNFNGDVDELANDLVEKGRESIVHQLIL